MKKKSAQSFSLSSYIQQSNSFVSIHEQGNTLLENSPLPFSLPCIIDPEAHYALMKRRPVEIEFEIKIPEFWGISEEEIIEKLKEGEKLPSKDNYFILY